MPVLCVEQAGFLEGVGDTVQQRFQDILQEREKEFEDGLFFGALATDQFEQDGLKNTVSDEAREAQLNKQFAGISLATINIEREELQNMSLKQFLVEQDRINFARRNGTEVDGVGSMGDGKDEGGKPSRKRKIGDVDVMNGEDEQQQNGAIGKRRKVTTDGFLDCGSVSWTLLLTIFFLSLHKGTTSSSEEAGAATGSEKFCMTLESCQEMLEVLAHEFGDMIPLETE